jgi:malate dehydrogenase (oxaloacetate-decarboxylating)
MCSVSGTHSPVSAAVAIAVAQAAARDGVARAAVDNPIQQVHDVMWRPEYPRLELVDDSIEFN